nr:hypothetical protein [Methylosinus sp. Ce-a6]
MSQIADAVEEKHLAARRRKLVEKHAKPAQLHGAFEDRFRARRARAIFWVLYGVTGADPDFPRRVDGEIRGDTVEIFTLELRRLSVLKQPHIGVMHQIFGFLAPDATACKSSQRASMSPVEAVERPFGRVRSPRFCGGASVKIDYWRGERHGAASGFGAQHRKKPSCKWPGPDGLADTQIERVFPPGKRRGGRLEKSIFERASKSVRMTLSPQPFREERDGSVSRTASRARLKNRRKLRVSR